MQTLVFRDGYAIPQDPYQFLLLHFLRYRQLFPRRFSHDQTTQSNIDKIVIPGFVHVMTNKIFITALGSMIANAFVKPGRYCSVI